MQILFEIRLNHPQVFMLHTYIRYENNINNELLILYV